MLKTKLLVRRNELADTFTLFALVVLLRQMNKHIKYLCFWYFIDFYSSCHLCTDILNWVQCDI